MLPAAVLLAFLLAPWPARAAEPACPPHGDLDGVRRAIVDVHPAERASLERLIEPRNAPMAVRIDALHAGGQRLFVAVGIMHMVGDGALPRLLAERGFTVERVQFDGRVGLGGAEGNPPVVPLPKE